VPEHAAKSFAFLVVFAVLMMACLSSMGLFFSLGNKSVENNEAKRVAGGEPAPLWLCR
jgi:hypothetical protein